VASESVLHVAISGRAGRVEARVPALPVRPDPRGGYRFVDPDFGASFFPLLWDEMPLADRSGSPWARRDVCFACRATLPDDGHPERMLFGVVVPKLDPIEVDLVLPITRCASCDEPQIVERNRSVEMDLSNALVAGLDAARVRA